MTTNDSMELRPLTLESVESLVSGVQNARGNKLSEQEVCQLFDILGYTSEHGPFSPEERSQNLDVVEQFIEENDYLEVAALGVSETNDSENH